MRVSCHGDQPRRMSMLGIARVSLHSRASRSIASLERVSVTQDPLSFYVSFSAREALS
jgi:hypothetical protein